MGQPPPPGWSAQPPYGQQPGQPGQDPHAQPTYVPQQQPPAPPPGWQGTPGYGQQPPPGPPGYGQQPPPPPGQPGYGPPPVPGRRRGGGGKVVGIVLGVVGGLVLLCGGGGVFVYFAFLRAGDPEEVVADYYSALQRGDCDALVDLVTEDTWREGGASSPSEAVADCDEAMDESGGGLGANLTLDDTRLVSEDGDRAVVAATITVFVPPELADTGFNTDTVDHDLRKEGGKWRIDGTSSQGPGTGGFELGFDQLPDQSGIEDPDLDDLEDLVPSIAPTPGLDLSQPADPPTATELWGGRDSFEFTVKQDSGDITGELTRLDMYDHPSCQAGALTQVIRADLADCVGRIEAAYVGEHDGIRVSQVVLTFSEEDSAASFVRHFDGVFAPELVAFTDPGDIANSGYYESQSASIGHHVVLSLFVSSSGADADVQNARNHRNWLHTETTGVFRWGGP